MPRLFFSFSSFLGISIYLSANNQFWFLAKQISSVFERKGSKCRLMGRLGRIRMENHTLIFRIDQRFQYWFWTLLILCVYVILGFLFICSIIDVGCVCIWVFFFWFRKWLWRRRCCPSKLFKPNRSCPSMLIKLPNGLRNMKDS